MAKFVALLIRYCVLLKTLVGPIACHKVRRFFSFGVCVSSSQFSIVSSGPLHFYFAPDLKIFKKVFVKNVCCLLGIRVSGETYILLELSLLIFFLISECCQI